MATQYAVVKKIDGEPLLRNQYVDEDNDVPVVATTLPKLLNALADMMDIGLGGLACEFECGELDTYEIVRTDAQPLSIEELAIVQKELSTGS